MGQRVWAIASDLRSLLLPPGIVLAVFGSYAAGRERPESDLDLWLDGPPDAVRLAASRVLQNAERLRLPTPVDIVLAPPSTALRIALTWTVATYGIPVVGRLPSPPAHLTAHTADQLWQIGIAELATSGAGTPIAPS